MGTKVCFSPDKTKCAQICLQRRNRSYVKMVIICLFHGFEVNLYDFIKFFPIFSYICEQMHPTLRKKQKQSLKNNAYEHEKDFPAFCTYPFYLMR